MIEILQWAFSWLWLAMLAPIMGMLLWQWINGLD
jgi:hypothetical protein